MAHLNMLEKHNGAFYGNRCSLTVLSALTAPVKHYYSTQLSVCVRVCSLCWCECAREIKGESENYTQPHVCEQNILMPHLCEMSLPPPSRSPHR